MIFERLAAPTHPPLPSGSPLSGGSSGGPELMEGDRAAFGGGGLGEDNEGGFGGAEGKRCRL